MSLSKIESRFTLTAAALFAPKDRIRMRSGFYEGEEGYVVQAGEMVQVKLDHIPQPITVGWNSLDNLTKPLVPFKYNRNR